MAIFKTKLKSGKVSWGYRFSIGNRSSRQQHKAEGYKTRGEAENAEAAARLEAAKDPQPATTPKTLGETIVSFIEDRKAELSPKTIARYAEMWRYLAPELLASPVGKVTALMLHKEWQRLREAGGHTRKDKAARPMSTKTVRNIAGLVSAAYGWAILYELCTVNPCTASRPPRGGDTRKAVALSRAQVHLTVEGAGGPWCLASILEVADGLGARRGEVLALRWADIQDGHAHIFRSLGQVGAELYWKGPKVGPGRSVEIFAPTMATLQAHRLKQNEFRQQFGSTYRTDLDLIFATPEGEPLRPDSVSSAVSALCKRLKLPKGASLHALRHTHGSQLIASGVPIPEVSTRLGHANPRTTMSVYAHAIPGTGQAARAWEKLEQGMEKGKRQ